MYPFKIEVHKYITKVDAINLGTPILRTYDKASTVALPIKKLTNFSGRIYYSIVVENTGSKEGIVSVVKDEMPSFMAFDETINPGFELKDGIIYDRNLEGIVLQPGEKIEDTLVLEIGPGAGALTYKLCQHAKHVICFEIDERVSGLCLLRENYLKGMSC